MRLVLLALVLGLFPAIGAADLRQSGEPLRVLPITLRDGKPMLTAEIGGRAGVVMFDLGTPYPIMANRDALDLAPGQEVARGHAASGQVIVVRLHPAAPVAIAGRPLPLTGPLPSGNFGFTRAGLGADFLGFLGLPVVADTVFALDLPGGRMLVFDRLPAVADRLAEVGFDLPDGGLPGWPCAVGSLPLRCEIDTGDGGTLYLSADSRTRLVAAGLLTGPDAAADIAGLGFGGGAFGPVPVRPVAAGGPEDHRDPPGGDLLRLGAGFLSRHGTLWDMPARRLVVFGPGRALSDVLRP